MSRQFVSLGNFNSLPSISLWSRDGEDRLKAQVQEVKEQYTSLPSERGNTKENDSRLYWTNPTMAIRPTGTVTIDKASNPKDMQESAASHTNNPFVHDVTNPEDVGQERQSHYPLTRMSFACPDAVDNGACRDNLNASTNVHPYPNDQPDVHLFTAKAVPPRSHSDTSRRVLAALGLSWEYRPVAQHKYQTFNKETTKTMLQRKARNVNSLRAKYNMTQNACVGGQLKHAESGMSKRAALLEKQNIKMQKEHEDRQNTTSSSLPGRREHISQLSELSKSLSECVDAEVSSSFHQPSDPTPSYQSSDPTPSYQSSDPTPSYQPSDPTPSYQCSNPEKSKTVQVKSENLYPRPRFPNVLEKKEKYSLACELLKETYMGKKHNKKRTQNRTALGKKADCCRDASLLEKTECDEPVLEMKTEHFDDANQTVTLRQPSDSSCTGVTKHHLAEKTNTDIEKNRNHIAILPTSHEDCNELLSQRLKEECTTNYPPGCKANFPQIQTPWQNQTHLYEHMELNQIQDRHGEKSHLKKRLPILSMKERVKTVKQHLTKSNTTSVVSQTQVVISNQKDARKHDIHKPVGKNEEITVQRTKSSPYYVGQGWYDPDPEDETALSTEENMTPNAPSKSSRHEASKRTCIQKSRSSPLHLALTQSFSRKCRIPTKSHRNKLMARQNGEHPNSSTPKTNLQDGKPICTTPVKQREANCGKPICRTPLKQGEANCGKPICRTPLKQGEANCGKPICRTPLKQGEANCGKPICRTPLKQGEANCGKPICTTPVKPGEASEMLRTYTGRNMPPKNKLSSFEEERKKVKAEIISLLEKTQKVATKSKGQGIQVEESRTVRHDVTHNNATTYLQIHTADNSSQVVVLSEDTLASGPYPFDCLNPSHNLSYRDADNTGYDVYSQKDADSIASDVHSQRYADSIGSDAHSQRYADNTGSDVHSQKYADNTGSDVHSQRYADNTGSDVHSQRYADNTGSDVHSQRYADNTGSDVHSQRYADNTGSDVHSKRNTDNDKKINLSYKKYNFRRLMLGLPIQKVNSDLQDQCLHGLNSQRNLQVHQLSTQSIGHTTTSLQSNFSYQIQDSNLESSSLLQSERSPGATPLLLDDLVKANPSLSDDLVNVNPSLSDDLVNVNPSLSEDPVNVNPSLSEDPVSVNPSLSEDPVSVNPSLSEDSVSVNPLHSEGLTPDEESLCQWVLGNNFPNVSLGNETSAKAVNTCVLHKDSKLYFLENLNKIAVNSSSLGHNDDESDEFVPKNHNPHIKTSYFSDLSLHAVTSLDIISIPKVSSPLHKGVTPIVSSPAGLATPLETVTLWSISSTHAVNTLNVSSQVDEIGTLSMSSSSDVVDTLSISSPVDAEDALSISSPVDAVDTLSVSSVDENLDTMNVTYQPGQ